LTFLHFIIFYYITLNIKITQLTECGEMPQRSRRCNPALSF
jgi:hypothetical protein